MAWVRAMMDWWDGVAGGAQRPSGSRALPRGVVVGRAACAQCGADPVGGGRHPYVGIGRADLQRGTGAMAAHPICGPCYTQAPRPIKVAYFHADQAVVALAAAEETDRRSRHGLPIGIGR